MANNYTLELTDIEVACGVTLEAVAEVLPKGAFFDSGSTFAIPANTPPAVAGAVARCAFGGPITFTHISRATGYLCYQAA